MISMHKLEEAIKQNTVLWYKEKKRTTVSIECIDALHETMKDAQGFDCGDAEDIDSIKIDESLIKLPFNKTWFEYQIESGKVIVLMAEVSKDDKIYENISPIENGLFANIFIINKFNVWELLAAILIDPNEINNLGGFKIYSLHNEDDYPEDNNGLINAALLTTCRFLTIINCNNIQKVENQAPKLINKKRKKKNKPVIHSYWTIKICGNKEKYDGSKHGGSHEAPRLHLRRGHVRQYRPGSFTWVNACLVGNESKGTVKKDYKVIH